MNEFSFKMLAYVIKGYIIILKKNYENFSREINHFLEFNLNVRSKPEKDFESKLKIEESKNKEKRLPNSTSILSMDNFSLLSDLSQNELNGFSSELAKQFLSTMRKMKNPSLKTLYEGIEKSEKLENLVKNFSENVKKSQDLFNFSLQRDIDNNLGNIFQENENLFSTYINFSVKLDENQSEKNEEKNENFENELPAITNQSQEKSIFGFDDKRDSIFLKNLGMFENISEKKLSYFKFDKEVNLSPEAIVSSLIEAERLKNLEHQDLNKNKVMDISHENVL